MKTGGFASAGIIDGEARIDADNDVKLSESSVITALGNVHLLAGTGLNDDRDRLVVESIGDEANASIIPIEDLNSQATILLDNFVHVGNGAEVNTARSINLIAEKNSITLTTAKGTGRNWLTALAGAIDSLFGSDGLSEKFDTGDTTLNRQTGVQVDGIIRVGTERNQTLTINKFGDIVPSGTTDNIKFN